MAEWSVLVEARSPDEETLPDGDPAVDRFFDLLYEPHSGAVSAEGGYWSARVSVDVDPEEGDPAEIVFHRAIEIVTKAAREARLPDWPVVRAELVDEVEFKMDLERPSFPELMGIAEVCEQLGISRQRLAELRTSGRFPDPIVTLSTSPIWLADAVRAFETTWDRRPGRPSRKCPMCDQRRAEVRTLLPHGVRIDQECTNPNCALKGQRVGLEREQVR